MTETPEHEAFVEGLTTDGRRYLPDVAELTDEQLTELNRLVNGERGRRYRNRRCQFVGEFVYRNGNSDTAQCTRKPHETGSHTYNGAVIDQ